MSTALCLMRPTKHKASINPSTPTDRKRSMSRLESILWPLAGIVLFLSFGYTEMAGSDMWWHVAAGREIFQTGTIWMVDDWSFTAHGADWLNHEWLSDVFYWLWVSAFGVETLVWWKWLVVISTYLLLQLTLYRVTQSWPAAFLCSAMAILVGAPFIDVRPHLYTLLNMCLLLYLLLQRDRPLWILLLLFLVWVNLHGGFFFGLMVLGALLFPWRNLGWEPFKAAFLVGLACLAVTLLNPSGIESLWFPLKYAFDGSSPYREIGEWLPPFQPGGIQSPWFATLVWFPLAGLAYLVPAIRRHTGVPWEGLVLTALTLAMALTSRRFIPIFGISLAVMLAPLLAWALMWLRDQRLRIAFAVIALGFALYRQLPYPVQAAPAFHYLTAEYSYPTDLVDAAQLNGLEGKVFAYYNWGGYLHWRTDGALKVYIDGRADTIYEVDEYLKYVKVLRDEPGWLDIVEQSGADYFLWPRGIAGGAQKYAAMQQSGNWRFVYMDAMGYLLARNEVELPTSIEKPRDSVDRMVTLGYERLGGGAPNRAVALATSARGLKPWHRTACMLAMTAYDSISDAAAVDRVAAACYRQFPPPLFERE